MHFFLPNDVYETKYQIEKKPARKLILMRTTSQTCIKERKIYNKRIMSHVLERVFWNDWSSVETEQTAN